MSGYRNRPAGAAAGCVGDQPFQQRAFAGMARGDAVSNAAEDHPVARSRAGLGRRIGKQDGAGRIADHRADGKRVERGKADA